MLTSRRVVQIAGSSRRVVTLSHRLPVQPVSVVLGTPAYLFVGLNAGEWGGGLQRIDRRTGDVRQLEQNATGDLCGGPLNAECDPVNGIVTSPWKADCVVAAVGLVHMTGHGRLVEVCANRIKVLHSEPCPGERASSCTMPFFGVVRANGSLLAVAPGELVRLDGSREPTHLPEPRLEEYSPFSVAFAASFVLVDTSANERHSVSGLTPLIASR